MSSRDTELKNGLCRWTQDGPRDFSANVKLTRHIDLNGVPGVLVRSGRLQDWSLDLSISLIFANGYLIRYVQRNHSFEYKTTPIAHKYQLYAQWSHATRDVIQPASVQDGDFPAFDTYHAVIDETRKYPGHSLRCQT